MKQFRDTPYYVTENGEIYRLWKTGFKKRKPVLNSDGYHIVSTCQFGIKKFYRVHRIVAECYQECYNSKLTNEQIEFIRKNYIARHPEFGTRAFGRKFNVSNSLISRIIKNKRWSHINPEQNLEYE